MSTSLHLPPPSVSILAGVAGVWKPWDWAAGVLIAREAGAVISAGGGADFRLMGNTILGAATVELNSSISALLEQHEPFRCAPRGPAEAQH